MKSMRIKTIFARLAVGVVFILTVTLSLIFSTNVSASADSKNAVLKKANAEGIYKCYTDGKTKSKFAGVQYKSFGASVTSITTGNYIGLPNVYNDLDDSAVSCEQLFDGYDLVKDGDNAYPGVFNLYSVSAPTSSSKGDIPAFLGNMGYKISKMY